LRGSLTLTLATLAVSTAAGCDQAAERTPAAERIPVAQVADSAGIRLMSYELAGLDVPPYRSVGEYDLQIGEIDGAPEYAFSRIVDLALLDDGSIMVSDGVASELRVYDASGAFLRAIGQPGEGPGEFAVAPKIAGVAGDTVYAFDRRSSRVTSFTLDGEFVESLTLRSAAAGIPQAIVRLDGGTYLSQSKWILPSAELSFFEARLELDSLVVAELDAAGASPDTVRVMADRTRAREVQDRGGGRIGMIQADQLYTTRAVVASNGFGAVVGHSEVFELEIMRPDWSTGTIVRVRGVENPATAADMRAHQETVMREQAGDREIHPMTRRLNIDFLPERMPSFGSVIVSELGDVWVSLSEYDLSEGLDWLVFEPTGELRGTVRTPADFNLRAVGGDHIVGFVLDEFDVPYVRRHPLSVPVVAPH
jgi:6-bladed beta-propeller